MTLEQDGKTVTTPYAGWRHFPTVDPVRAHALRCAVELYVRDTDRTAKEVVEVAEMFEAYLRGGESGGP